MPKLHLHPQKSTIANAVSSGVGSLSELGEEMREWANNMESNNMEHMPKYDEVTTAADALEEVNEEPDCPEQLAGIEVTWQLQSLFKSRVDEGSRANRCSNAVSALQAAHSAIETYLDDLDDDADEAREAAESYRDEVQSIIDTAEGIDFPGMY